MAHYALIDEETNLVTNVLVVPAEFEDNGEEYLNSIGFEGRWLKTSYNTQAGEHAFGGTPLRKNYAGIGYLYSAELDAFIPPKPILECYLDESTCQWVITDPTYLENK